MKVVFDNIIYSLQKSGGGSVYWTELMKRFNKSNEVQATFYEQKEPNNNIFNEQIEFKNIFKETFLNLSVRRYLNFTEKITAKSIFHSSYFRISKSKNAINVTTIHDFTTEKFRKGLARFVNFQQKKYAVLNSDGIICISENTKKDLLSYIPVLDSRKVKVIYNGVSEDFFYIDGHFSISDKDKRFEILENKKYLIYIGHRTSYKNFPIAVKAAGKVKDEFKLVIIGEDLSDSEKGMVEKYLGSNYLLISKLQNKELNFLYNQAFALLYPSSYEGFGIPIVEAMKTRCPVIASKNSSIPEVAGDAAILYNNINEDLIVEGLMKLQDVTFRENLLYKGTLQSARFNWDNTYKQYLEFYKELYDAR